MPNDLVHLSAGGVSLVLDCRDHALPAVVHWGAALGPLDATELAALADADVLPLAGSEPDHPVRVAVLPEPHRGWTGRPGLTGHRDGRDWSPAFTVTALEVTDTTSDPAGPPPARPARRTRPAPRPGSVRTPRPRPAPPPASSPTPRTPPPGSACA